jgi:DNA-binding NtrC family response regulator
LCNLVASVGLRVTTYGSAAEFLEASRPDAPACLVLDLQLPGSSGLDLQRELADGSGPPIVFITGHGDIPSPVRAMTAGAVEFLPKPFGDEDLLLAIDAALGSEPARHRQTTRFGSRNGFRPTPGFRDLVPGAGAAERYQRRNAPPNRSAAYRAPEATGKSYAGAQAQWRREQAACSF